MSTYSSLTSGKKLSILTMKQYHAANLPTTAAIPTNSLHHATFLTFDQTLEIGAEFHHLYLNLTFFPFTVIDFKIVSAWHTKWSGMLGDMNCWTHNS